VSRRILPREEFALGCGLLAAFVLLLAGQVDSAWAQARVQFPSPLAGSQTAPSPSTYAAPNQGQAPATTPGSGAPYSQPAPYGQPGQFGQPAPYGQPNPYAQPGVQPQLGTPGQPQTYTPTPGAYGTPPTPLGPQGAPVGPIPGGQYGGGIQAPPAYWDPYGSPGANPPSLLPNDPYLPYNTPDVSFQNATRFLQEVRLDYVWLVGHGPGEFGVNDAELYGTFAIPFFRNTQTPLLITPGLAVHFWEGPEGGVADLPPNAYDAYLQAAWNPQVTPTFGGELAFRVGIHSDFRRVIDESIRYQGKGLGVLSLSPNMKVKAGVWYLDRNRVKLLPAGGLVWTPQGPDGNMRFDILFPNPKIAFRLSNYRSTQWWLYGRGEYGGGSWTVKRAAGYMDQVDYNDIRAAVGMEFIRPSGFSGLFEVGVAFDRQLYYTSLSPEFYYPKTTVFLRGSVAY